MSKSLIQHCTQRIRTRDLQRSIGGVTSRLKTFSKIVTRIVSSLSITAINSDLCLPLSFLTPLATIDTIIQPLDTKRRYVSTGSDESSPNKPQFRSKVGAPPDFMTSCLSQIANPRCQLKSLNCRSPYKHLPMQSSPTSRLCSLTVIILHFHSTQTTRF